MEISPNIPSSMGKNGKPGASLFGWSEYFKNSEIFGADIDKDILFQNEKIKTFYCDQTDKESIKKLWNNTELFENFDIIIEDGLHEFSANVTFFENSINKLKKNGYYIIEDICISNKNSFIKKINEWKKIYRDLDIHFYKIPLNNGKRSNNNVIVFKKI